MSNIVNVLLAPVYIGLLVLEPILRLFGWAGKTAGERFRRHKEAGVHGDAAWMSAREMKAKGFLEPRGFLAGTLDGRAVYLDGETSAVMFGIRGAGKTQTTIANVKSLRRRTARPDLILSDPAGDIETATAEDLKAMGYRVIRLDLTSPKTSDRYDPLTYLRPQYEFDYGRDVQALCELLMPDTRESDVGIHFLQGSRSMLQAMMMWRQDNPDREQGLRAVCRGLIRDMKVRTAEFASMLKHPHDLVRTGVGIWDRAGDRERGSFDSTLVRKLKPWVDDAVAYITNPPPDEERWTFEDVFSAEKPIAVFLRTGLGNEEYGGPFVRLVMGNAINTARRMWNRSHQRLRKGLWVFVDEARTAGNVNAVTDAVNELRKAGVNVFLCFHSLADVKATYLQPQALLNGCAWVVTGGARDTALYEEVSKLVGDYTAQSSSTNKGDDRESRGKHDIPRRLIKPDEIERLPEDEVIVVGKGLVARLKKPFRIRKGRVVYD